MTTAASGLDNPTTDTANSRRRRRRFRRGQLAGAAVAVATLAAATVTVIGGGTQSADAQFGVTPPPASSTLCETNHPAEVDYDAFTNNALDWPNKVPVSVALNSIDGDAQSPTFGVITPFSGDYTYTIVLDNSGDPFDPNKDNHPSFHPVSSHTPIVLTGGGTGTSITVDLPPGCRYMMSVRTAGHDLGGSWIRIEADGTVDSSDVNMVTNDQLPMAQLVVQAYHDYAQVNSQFDIGEPGLPGFDVVVEDGGDRAIDYFGNPLCTNYVVSGGTNPLKLDAGDLDINGQPTIDPVNPGGNCQTDSTGTVVIKYIPAGKYGVLVIPPDGTDWLQTSTIEGTHVIDTWLMPGDPGIGGEFVGDINAASFQAFGFISPSIHPDPARSYHYPYAPDVNGGDITGCIFNGLFYPSDAGIQTVPQNGIANLDGTKEPVKGGFVALNDVGTHDSMMDVQMVDANGCFRFTDVPQGSYQLALMDYELLYIIGFYNTTVGPTTMQPDPADAGAQNGVVDMGDMFVFRWFGMSSGYVFYDSGITADGRVIGPSQLKDNSLKAAANGVRDCWGQNDPGFVYADAPPSSCEPGIPGETVLIRERDGSITKVAVTDANGHYYIPAIWGPLFRFEVIEVAARALDVTGHSVHDQFDNNAVHSQGNCPANVDARLAQPDVFGPVPQNCLPDTLGGGLLLASIFQQGKETQIDFGKLSYLDPNAPNGFFNGGTGNGGIMGSVVNTVTRVEWAASQSAAEDDEPGVPGVTVNLWGLDTGCTLVDPVNGSVGAHNPDCYTVPLQTLETDSYQHPGLHRNGQACGMPQVDGTEYADVNPTFLPVGENCVGSWLIGPHTKDGAWDGGFAFSDLQAGHYVVEVVPPPGYQIVKENDLNVNEGNSFVPAIPPSGCAGEYHFAQVDSSYDPLDPVLGSAYDAFDDSGAFVAGSQPVRLCDRRLVSVQPFRNAGVDIMLMTDGMDRNWQSNYVDPAVSTPVDPYTIPNQSWQSIESIPMPGRMFGLVLDDLQMTADRNALTLGEQRGVAGVPVGVYDSTGNYVTTAWTDENGHYDFLLPASISINRATPRGVGPQMYKVVINDPGPTGNNYGYDPAYITNPNVLEIFSGKMTPADTPLLSLSSGPCSLPTGTPDFFNVNKVWGNSGSLPSNYLINGLNLVTSTVSFTPSNADGTLDEAAAINANPWITSAVTLPAPSPDPATPPSFYDQVTIDLHQMELDLAAAGTPLAPGPYQVSFSQGTKLSEIPRNGITFHVLGTGYDLDVHTVPAPTVPGEKVIQATIEAFAGDGIPDLIVVPQRSYRESLVLHEAVVIQGFGPGGTIAQGTELGAIQDVELPYAFQKGSIISPFGALLDASMYGPWETLMSGITWDGNQGAEVGPAFQVLLNAGEVTMADAFQIDGFGITSVRAKNGAIFVNGNADGLVISNNALQANNAGEGGAAIGLGTHSSVTFERVAVGDPTGNFSLVNGAVLPVTPGTGELRKITGRSDANNNNVVIRDNRILQNGGIMLAGGVSIFNGNTNYRLLDNDICGNYSSEYGGGVTHFGFSDGGLIKGNVFQNNESFDEGGGLMLAGEPFLYGPLDIGLGSGAVNIEGNQFLFNLSGDDGGGIMMLHPLDSPVRIANNIISDNAATDMGGGIHMLDASAATIVHNTFANNLSSSSAEDAGGFSCIGDVRTGPGTGTNTCPRAGGLTTQPNSTTFQATLAPGAPAFSDADLKNNIFWNNQAGFVNAGPAAPINGKIPVFPGVPDVGVYDGVVDMGAAATPMVLNPENSILTVPYGAATTNQVGIDPQFVLDLPLEVQTLVAPIFGQLANVNMVYPALSPVEASDYHIAATSPAVDLGLMGVDGFDIDGEIRPFVGPIGGNTAPDAGADEVVGASASGLMFFSTIRLNDANLGISGLDAQQWAATGISTVLSGVGTAANPQGPNIDGLHVLSPTSFLVSFLGDDVTLPGGIGGAGAPFTVQDQDIVAYDAATNTWSLAVDGSAVGLLGGARDIDAFHRNADGSYLVSFTGFAVLPTQGGLMGVRDEDVVRMVPVASVAGTVVSAYFEPWFSGSLLGLDLAGGAGDVDGVALINAGNTLLLSMKGTTNIATTTGTLNVRDEDVIACTGVTRGPNGLITCTPSDFAYFDGTVEGLAGNNDVNAVSGPLAP